MINIYLSYMLYKNTLIEQYHTIILLSWIFIDVFAINWAISLYGQKYWDTLMFDYFSDFHE